MSFRVGPPPFLTGRLLLGLALAGLFLSAVCLPFFGTSAGWVFVASQALAFVIVYIPATLVIGSDGLAISWLSLRVFVPYASIEHWQRTEQGITVRATGGRLFEVRTKEADKIIPTLGARKTFGDSAQGILAHEALASDWSLLAPEPDASAWAARLRRVGGAGADGGGDYRQASLPRERLLAVLATPSLPQEVRAAAAVALGAPENEEEDRVMSRAIASTASRTLARALFAAASPDRPAAATKALARVRRASEQEQGDRQREAAEAARSFAEEPENEEAAAHPRKRRMKP